MPYPCFSYPPEVGSLGVVPPVRGSKICFSYPADVPSDVSNRNIAQSTSSACAKWGYLGCFSY